MVKWHRLQARGKEILILRGWWRSRECKNVKATSVCEVYIKSSCVCHYYVHVPVSKMKRAKCSQSTWGHSYSSSSLLLLSLLLSLLLLLLSCSSMDENIYKCLNIPLPHCCCRCCCRCCCCCCRYCCCWVPPVLRTRCLISLSHDDEYPPLLGGI